MPGPPACSIGCCPTRPGATRSDEDGVQTELIPLPSHIDTALRVLTCPAGTPSCGAGSDPPFVRRAEATHTESAVSLSDRVSLLMPAPGLTLRHTHSHSQARIHTQNSHTRGGVHAPPPGGGTVADPPPGVSPNSRTCCPRTRCLSTETITSTPNEPPLHSLRESAFCFGHGPETAEEPL